MPVSKCTLIRCAEFLSVRIGIGTLTKIYSLRTVELHPPLRVASSFRSLQIGYHNVIPIGGLITFTRAEWKEGDHTSDSKHRTSASRSSIHQQPLAESSNHAAKIISTCDATRSSAIHSTAKATTYFISLFVKCSDER
jgi:hypothetical protein